MSMTKERRLIQNKLKRKYSYISNGKPNSGVCISKKDANVVSYSERPDGRKYNIITDFAITMDCLKIAYDDKDSIGLFLPKFKQYEGEENAEQIEMSYVKISFEELESLYKIALELKREVEGNE